MQCDYQRPFFKKLIIGLVGFRVTVLAVCSFLPFSLPGVWRQTDTMGVAMRYWMRWTVEPSTSMPFLPAVLNSGDTTGINAMEFPLLNLLFAPAFALGPYWGKVVAMLGVLLLVHGLIYLNYRTWKDCQPTLGTDSFAFFLMAVATFSSGWTGKFIPDFISVLLVLLGVGTSWSKTHFLKSGLLCAAGILMKPTSIVVMFLYLAHPKPVQRLRANFLWGISAIAAAFLYYTLGIHWIQKYQIGSGLFAIEPRPFFYALVDFFKDITDWTRMWTYRTFFSLGIFLILPLSVIAVFKKMHGFRSFVMIWVIFLVQYVFIAGLSGIHGFTHDYYFLGLAPTAAMLLWWLISKPWPKFILVIIFMGLLIPTVELSLMDLRSLYKSGYQEFLYLFNDCQTIKSHHPELPWNQGVPFRSSDEPYPALGLCFGERQGSQIARYGFFWNGSIPKACKIIEKTKWITLGECGT